MQARKPNEHDASQMGERLEPGLAELAAAPSQTFTSSGPIPGVAPLRDAQGPSASDRAYGSPLYDRATQTKADEQKNQQANFNRLTKRGLKKKDAPPTIILPEPLTKGLQTSWDRSHPDGKSQEQGGNLVRNKDDSYGWRQGTPGSAGVYLPDTDDLDKGQKLIGIGHTHPYDDGQENVSFSGTDIAGLVDEQQPLNIVQSGKTLFLIARTAEFDAMVKDLDDDQSQALSDKIEATWTNCYNNFKGTIAEKAEAATIRTCHEFKLVYYRGEGKTMQRVE